VNASFDYDGKNIFHCNSTAAPASHAGYDIWFDMRNASEGTVSFVGNLWDHSAPTSGGNGGANGTDVVSKLGPQVDLTRADLASGACPAGRVR
jgi:hypothetical protein